MTRIAIMTMALLLAAGPASAADVFNGQRLYERHCANCHGADGAPTLPGSPDFSRGEGLLQPDMMLVETLRNGVRTMPGFDAQIDDRGMLDVLAYARTLRR